MGTRRRQAAFWIVLLIGTVLVVGGALRYLASVRVHDGVIMYGPFAVDVPPPCAPLPRSLAVEELATQNTSCHLGGTVVTVPGEKLSTLSPAIRPRDVRITLPEGVGSTARSGDDGAGGIGVIQLLDGMGVVVYTRDRAWGRPEGVALVREAGLLDDPILEPVPVPMIPGPW